MKKGSLVFTICVVLFVVIMGIIIFLALPKIKLVGDNQNILLEGEYVEPGYKATKLFKDMTKDVVVTNNIDNTKVGMYEVVYKLKTKEVKRNVRVYEDVPPEITLEGETTYYVCPNGNFEEVGYTATDNYDGDITDKVEVKVDNDLVTYTVSDSSSNKTIVNRKLVFEDKDAPTIELTGGNVSIKVGGSYEEPGYKATDNCLGDITDKVIIEGSVDTNTVGSYELTYKVSDDVNEVSVTRTVRVLSNVATLGTENAGGVIYLTFDDGPSATYTRIVLDALNKYNVKATFFVVPTNPNLHYLIKEAYNSGHSIGIHSMSHTYSIVYASDQSLYDDISATNEVIKSITGNYTYLYRYPGGSSNTVSRNYSRGIMSRTSSELHNMGYHYFDWNVSSGDASGGSHTSDEIAGNVIRSLSKSRYNVVLMHDTHDYTAYAVEKIIEYGIANGYTFAPITMNTKESHHGIAN